MHNGTAATSWTVECHLPTAPDGSATSTPAATYVACAKLVAAQVRVIANGAAPCGTDKLVGGGCYCDTAGTYVTSSSSSGNGWGCACTGGGEYHSVAICISGPGSYYGASSWPPCAQGKLLGGGCIGSSGLTSSGYPNAVPSASAWQCPVSAYSEHMCVSGGP